MRPPVRFLLVALSGASGYFAVSAITGSSGPALRIAAPANATTSAASATLAASGMITGALEESRLVAEWEQLLATDGQNAADFPSLYDKIKKLEDPFRRRAFRAAAMADWAARDPALALRYLREKDKWNATQFVREWLRRDPDAAINQLLGEGKAGADDLTSILEDVAKLAPGRLAEICAKLPPSGDRWATGPQTAFAAFAAKDLDAARAMAETVTGTWRSQALAGVAKAWGEKDGAGALAWAQAMPAGDVRDAALKGVLTGWAKSDPFGALSKLSLVPPGGDDMYFASDTAARVLAEAAKKDWGATMDWLKKNPGEVGRSSMDGLQDAFSRRLKADPIPTMREILDGGVPGLAGVFGNSILNDGYVQRDAIWTWLDTQPKNPQTEELRSSLINAMAWKEPEVALEFLGKFPNTAENQALFERAAQSIVNGGSRAGRLEEFMDKAPPSMRASLLEYGLMYGHESIGADAEHWVARLDELPKEKRDNAVGGLARGWAANDPEAASQWALKLTDTHERQMAFDSVSSIWATNDSVGFAQLLETLPKGTERDRGTQGLISALVQEHPAEAWSWAMEIQDESSRMNALRGVYGQTLLKNSTGAEDLLQSANFPPEVANRIRALPKGPPEATEIRGSTPIRVR